MRLASWQPIGLAALIALAGCRSDPNEPFIQGYWRYSDPHLGAQVSEKGQVTTWIFDEGGFRTDACCFFEQHLSGRYRIVKSEGDALILELYALDGNLKSDRLQIQVIIDREADTLKIQRAGPYQRLTP